MRQPLVSVLVSLYNVEAFVAKKRISDIREQTYSNLEIILVDDGSTDNTFKLCQTIAEEDDRILLFHKDNGGLGSARNAGLKIARGEYVYFCDVDDFPHKDLIAKCVEIMEQKQPDMLVFGFQVKYTFGVIPEEYVSFPDMDLDSNAAIKGVFVDKLLLVRNGNGFVWNKFYRRTFLEKNHFRFGTQSIQQDELFNMRIYPKINHMVVSSEILYDYFIYKKGNNRSHYIPDRFDIYREIYNSFKAFFVDWGIANQKTERYVYHRFFMGICDAILYNAFLPEANLSIKQRKSQVLEILSDPDTKKCLQYVVRNEPLSFESRRYVNSFLHKNYYELCFWRNCFTLLRKFKHKLLQLI